MPLSGKQEKYLSFRYVDRRSSIAGESSPSFSNVYQLIFMQHTSFLGREIISVRVVAWWINAPGPDGLESDGSHRQAETLVTFIDN